MLTLDSVQILTQGLKLQRVNNRDVSSLFMRYSADDSCLELRNDVTLAPGGGRLSTATPQILEELDENDLPDWHGQSNQETLIENVQSRRSQLIPILSVSDVFLGRGHAPHMFQHVPQAEDRRCLTLQVPTEDLFLYMASEEQRDCLLEAIHYLTQHLSIQRLHKCTPGTMPRGLTHSRAYTPSGVGSVVYPALFSTLDAVGEAQAESVSKEVQYLLDGCQMIRVTDDGQRLPISLVYRERDSTPLGSLIFGAPADDHCLPISDITNIFPGT